MAVNVIVLREFRGSLYKLLNLKESVGIFTFVAS